MTCTICKNAECRALREQLLTLAKALIFVHSVPGPKTAYSELELAKKIIKGDLQNNPKEYGYIVRKWDIFDGWTNVSQTLTQEQAENVWNELTHNGTRHCKYMDGCYYAIFRADTVLDNPTWINQHK